MRQLQVFLLLVSMTFQDLSFSMTLDEKIGQLFIVAAYSNAQDAQSEGQTQPPVAFVEEMIESYHVGGVLFKMRWSPTILKHLAAHFQQLSQVPLFTCIDAEWGLGQRMELGESFPKNLTLGYLEDDALIYQMGREVGRQCRELGINFNLAPVVDVNTNPMNPVIHDRSFGSDPAMVSQYGYLMMRGLQDNGVMACAKHFPGHGDTSIDSHTGLPHLHHSWDRIESIELRPFKALISGGVMAVMGGHLLVSAIDPELPASLSKKAITDLLQKDLGFEGVVITDDLLMDAVAKRYTPGDAALMAFVAGNDLILTSQGAKSGIAKIKEAIKRGDIEEKELDRRVAKILQAKRWIAREREVEPQKIKSLIYSQAVKIVQGEKKEAHEGVMVQVGGRGDSYISRKSAKMLFLSSDSTEKERASTHRQLEGQSVVTVALFDISRAPGDRYGIRDGTIALVQEMLANQQKVILILFGNPNAKELFSKEITIVAAHDLTQEAQEAVAALLFE